MNTGSEPPRPVKTVKTAFEILGYIKEEDGATLSELDGVFDLAKSTIHRHLATLQTLEFVVQDGGTFHPSLRFLEFGEHARHRKPAYAVAKSKVQELAETTEERAHFLVEEHGWAVFVHRAAGAQAVETDPGLGKLVPLHATAAGKAILAHIPDPDRRAIIDTDGLPAFTENTITDREELDVALTESRDRGYSFNRQENTEGLRSVGVPVIGEQGAVIGALSVSGPTHRFRGKWFEETLPDLLLETANELELESGRVPTSGNLK
jgi:DNA-binding IclR family transcriptional regulator